MTCYKFAKLPELFFRHPTLFKSIIITGVAGSLLGSAGLVFAGSQMIKMLITKVLPLVVGSDGRLRWIWMKPRKQKLKKPSSCCYV